MMNELLALAGPKIARADLFKSGLEISLGRQNVVLTPDMATRNLKMRLAVPNLLVGLWVQLADALSRQPEFRICQHCKDWFEAGSRERRADAKFCSDEHRIEFNSLKRKKKG
jgi:hypothetical protein